MGGLDGCDIATFIYFESSFTGRNDHTKVTSTASRSLCEVKHFRAQLVLRWGTTLESQVLFFCYFVLHYTHYQIYITSSNTQFTFNIYNLFLHFKLNDKPPYIILSNSIIHILISLVIIIILH